MNPRKPRPPVAEQGTSRAYREGRLQDPDRSAPSGSRLLFGWVAVVIGAAAYTAMLSLDSFVGGTWSWLTLIGAAGTAVGAGLLRTNRRGWWRRTSSRWRVASLSCVVALAVWIALSFVAGGAWRWHGIDLATVSGLLGLVLWIATFWSVWQGQNVAAGRNTDLTTTSPVSDRG